jgi:hypothetical protein
MFLADKCHAICSLVGAFCGFDLVLATAIMKDFHGDREPAQHIAAQRRTEETIEVIGAKSE